MQVKQQYELIVFPKTFTILNFYSKGLYSLQISLTAQQQSTNNIIKGFPSVIQGSNAVRNEQKKAKVIMKDNKLAYSSQNFYVTFSAENFYFHAMPSFKLQLQRQKQYKVYIDFNLILTQYRISKNHSSSTKDANKNNQNYLTLGSIDQKVMIVDTKRLYLNNLSELNTYQRIIFSEPDYFSYTDAYIFSMKTATHVRPYGFGLYEFHLLSIQQRSKLQFVKSQQITTLLNQLSVGCNKEMRKLFNQGMIDFYKYMIEKPINQYKNLAYVVQHFRAMMLTLNNSTITQSISIPFLDYISKSLIPSDTQTTLTETELKQSIQEYYQTQNQAEIYLQIMHQAQLISRNKACLLSQLCQLLIKINYNVFQLLAEPIVREKIETKERQFIFHGDIQKEKNKKHSQFLTFRQNYCRTQSIVEDVDLRHPFIMLQGYQEFKPQNNKKQTLPAYVIDNLVVFVHGYQGSDFDLQIAKYNLQMYNTHSYCLMSTSIQDDMDESIEYLGLQLATQVKEHIKHTYNTYKRINFIGYSLGGIVIREAIRHLEEYKEKMNLFLSLASPHTGTIDGANILIKTGIWYLINFQNAKNIKQLHCQFQGKEEENFILKKLSECDTLQWFKKFVVASSEQDSFVPYTSSRIDGIEGSSMTKIMCENIKKRIKKLERVEVWFQVNQDTGTLDKILGRRAHIQFLENKVFLHCLFKLYASQF